ncbi:hypothetical protein [Caballeronia sp. S22]|uniref:hypothetical protein n=1 Tax=Caballeronia sp. S22 TaxID=3137182 RepID=UPI003530C0E2
MTDTQRPYDLAALIAEAAKTSPDMRIPVVSNDYVPPPTGFAGARLVGYFELGKHEEEFEGRKRDREKVDLVFELSGPNYEPRKLADADLLVPHRTTVQETLSFDYESMFSKLFAAMNAAHGGTSTHMVQLLGKPFTVEVFHRPSRDGKKVYANLKGPRGYNVKGTTVQNPVTGKAVTLEVAPAITELKAFIWNLANKTMWDSIFIPGEYGERKNDNGEVISPKRSRNVLQERIMRAKNFAEIREFVSGPSVPPGRTLSIEELRLDERAIKQWQDDNWRDLKACIGRAIQETGCEKKPRRSSAGKRRAG